MGVVFLGTRTIGLCHADVDTSIMFCSRSFFISFSTISLCSWGNRRGWEKIGLASPVSRWIGVTLAMPLGTPGVGNSSINSDRSFLRIRFYSSVKWSPMANGVSSNGSFSNVTNLLPTVKRQRNVFNWLFGKLDHFRCSASCSSKFSLSDVR